MSTPDQAIRDILPYLDVLESEIMMCEEAIERLQAGDIPAGRLDEALPDPTPMEAWRNDQWTDTDVDVNPLNVGLDDDETDADE